MEINVVKTKVMGISNEKSVDQNLDQEDLFKYVGSIIIWNGR